MADESKSGSPANRQDVIKSDNNPPESEFEKVAKSYRIGWVYAEYAFQYGATIVLCTLIGYWLDSWLKTGNILMIAGVIFGSIAGFVNLIRAVYTKNPSKTNDGK